MPFKVSFLLMGYSVTNSSFFIIQLKNPSDVIKPTYEYGEDSEFYSQKVGLRNYAVLFAKSLKVYASSILTGDFNMFKVLDETMREKYKDYFKC
jgi:hypothetical protein